MANQGERKHIPDGIDVLNMLAGEQATDELRLPLDKIRLDGGTQPRDKIDWDRVTEYAMEMADGAQFPAVDVFYDGTDYWLADGFHRWHAASKCAQDPEQPKMTGTILVKVHQGTRRDAQLFSVGVNATHGIRRTNADKRRAVEKLLGDSEWGQWSDREIARRCKVSHPFVAHIREELSGNDYQMDAKWEAAKSEVEAAGGKVGRLDDAPIPPRPVQPETRKVKRGDKVYEQKVSSAARSEAAQVRPGPVPAQDSRPPTPAPKPAAPAPRYTDKPRVLSSRVRDEEDWLDFTEQMLRLLRNDDGSGFEIEVRKA